MVTVIPTKEELKTPVHNGVTGGSSCDNERPFQFIKDYQEVDFHRTPSCKPLPEDLLDITNGQITKSSIKGTFFMQIDAIESMIQINSNNQNLLLTLTDGISTIQAITNEFIPNLTINTKSGSKLLLTDIIQIQNGFLQLTHDNTQFQYGSNTYPRPRSSYRGYRGNNNGSYRTSYDGGRRNNRYDNDDSENNFFKRPPPKNTLMDFMTSLNISNDNENDKIKERSDNNNNNKRQSNENVQILSQQDDNIDESLDPEDDPTHANYRERRNPLPPRLQRVQEERSRRNTNRYYDEPTSSVNDTLNNQSSTSYIGHIDQGTYNTYIQPLNNSTSTHLTYYPPNLNYNNQTLINPTYPNEHMNYYCGITYSTYIPSNINGNDNLNDENNDSGIKSETSSNEQKFISSPSSSSNDNNIQEIKPNLRPRWKIGDMCLARWSEDGEFYYATIMDIQPPFCTILFVEYNTYEQVHFNDLKILSRDQQFYSFIPPTSSDLNIIPSNTYYPSRTNYYPSTLDGCIIMPEAPPFPFNSAGTLYMYPTMIQTNGDLTTISNDNNQQQQQQQQGNSSFPQPCSIADAPLTLVTSDDERQGSLSTESINDEQQ